MSKRSSLTKVHLFRNFIVWVCLEGQWCLIGVDRNLGRRTTELFITSVQPSKEQSEAVLSVSYHIRTYWTTSLHLENDLQRQAWLWVDITAVTGLHFQAIALQNVKCVCLCLSDNGVIVVFLIGSEGRKIQGLRLGHWIKFEILSSLPTSWGL